MSRRALRVIPVAVASAALALSGPAASMARNGADDAPGHHHHHKHHHHHHGADDGANHN